MRVVRRKYAGNWFLDCGIEQVLILNKSERRTLAQALEIAAKLRQHLEHEDDPEVYGRLESALLEVIAEGPEYYIDHWAVDPLRVFAEAQ